MPPKTIAMLVYPDAQCLDVTGPMEVFGLANRQLVEDRRCREAPYRLVLLSEQAGPVRMSSGLQVIAEAGWHAYAARIDTLLVSGGMGDCMDRARKDRALVAWLSKQAGKVRRIGSVCNGALLLAESGLLDDHRATTHWKDVPELARSYRRVRVVGDAIYVRDKSLWTSAGVTAGMDLALAMVSEDWDSALALRIAKRMVLYMKRSGGQKQFSDLLGAQMRGDSFGALIDWLRENFHRPLTVELMAARVQMSGRSFSRRFTSETNMTPGKFLESLRMEAARTRLETTRQPLARIAVDCGFGTEDTLRRTFHRVLRVSPRVYREHFGRAAGR